jgi:hypothetical protein
MPLGMIELEVKERGSKPFRLAALYQLRKVFVKKYPAFISISMCIDGLFRLILVLG